MLLALGSAVLLISACGKSKRGETSQEDRVIPKKPIQTEQSIRWTSFAKEDVFLSGTYFKLKTETNLRFEETHETNSGAYAKDFTHHVLFVDGKQTYDIAGIAAFTTFCGITTEVTSPINPLFQSFYDINGVTSLATFKGKEAIGTGG